MKKDPRACKTGTSERILPDPDTEKAALGHVCGDAVNGLVKVSTGSSLLNDLQLRAAEIIIPDREKLCVGLCT